MKPSLLLLSTLLTTIVQVLTSNTRIIGGISTTIESHPYQVSIFVSGTFADSGSIIAPNTVVTVAHCVSGSAAESFTIRAGSSSWNSGGKILNVSNITVIPEYGKPVVLENNIALITLAEDLVFGVGVQAMKLPDPASAQDLEVPDICQEVVVSGWGNTKERGSLSPTLQACADAYADYVIPVTESMFCAGVPGGRKGSCQVGSGGPVVAGDGDISLQETPSVYSRVVYFREWVGSVTSFRLKGEPRHELVFVSRNEGHD
ncbi:trypsin-like cysteine/serine peptidase domain-containing protein [Aspergillus oleicola]